MLRSLASLAGTQCEDNLSAGIIAGLARAALTAIRGSRVNTKVPMSVSEPMYEAPVTYQQAPNIPPLGRFMT